VFRRVLGEPANAASELRAALPPAIVDRLDLDQLAPVPGTFVDTTLSYRHTDLLFTAPLEGRKAFIYVLVEHQSSADPLMAFRLLRYVIRIWDRFLSEHPDTAQLPAVIPLVVHHNQRAWTGPTEILDLIDLDERTAQAWKEYLPQFRFVLDDLVRVDVQTLRERPLTPPARLTLLLLKIAPGNPHLVLDLWPWLDELRVVLQGPDGREVFTTLLRYIGKVGDTEVHDPLRDLIAALGPEAEEAYVTIAEMLEARGLARGRAEVLVELLTLKFGPLAESVVDSVHKASADQIRTWTARVLTAQTLDQLFR